MAQKHKIGVHVSAQQRDNYGVAAPHLVSVVTFDPGAFDEIPDEAIKIFRTHAIPNHKDAPGDFDRLPDEDLEGAAEFWWTILRRQYEPIRRQYGDDVYFQPINEINNPRTIMYLRGMVKAAEKDGYKLALWGDAGGSPDLPDWIETWMPFMKEVQAGGHIYSRHAYSGVTVNSIYLTNEDGTPSDSNTGRPFVEAKLMLENGIYMPMVITELGWLAGWNGLPRDWLPDILRYNELMMAHDNIVGSCLWNAGQWETAPNILAGRPLLDLGNRLNTMTPQFYVPGSIKLPEPVTDPEDPSLSAPTPAPVPVPTPPVVTPEPTKPTPEPPPTTGTANPGDFGMTLPSTNELPISVTSDPDHPTSTTNQTKNHLLVERFRDLEWYDWKLPNGDKSNMQVPVVLDVENRTGENPFSDGKDWNRFGLAEASYLTTGHNLSPDQKELYTEYESLVTPGGYVVYKLFSTHAFHVTYSAEIDVSAGQAYRVETNFYADFAHYQDPRNGNHKKVTDRMDPRHGLVRLWADGHEFPHQQIQYLTKQNVGVDFIAAKTGKLKVYCQYISSYSMAPNDGVAGYFITEISASELLKLSAPVQPIAPVTPVAPTPEPTDPVAPTVPNRPTVPSTPNPADTAFVPPVVNERPISVTGDSPATPKHMAIIIKVGQEESAKAAAKLMERYAYDRRRSLTFSADDMLTLLRGGNQQSIVEIYRPELPSNQDAIRRLEAAGYSWREIRLDWGR